MNTRNQITETVKLQTGLHLYKTGQSKFWYVRILIPKTKKRISRSTQETSRIEAKKVAYEIYQDFMSKPARYAKIETPNAFKVYIDRLIDKQRREVESAAKSDDQETGVHIKTSLRLRKIRSENNTKKNAQPSKPRRQL
ncbi:hypothetical protein N9L40_02145 [Rhodobacteraceae bacterium]|nr:hypothetical protein [Paracoccaceae bacterium]